MLKSYIFGLFTNLLYLFKQKLNSFQQVAFGIVSSFQISTRLEFSVQN